MWHLLFGHLRQRYRHVDITAVIQVEVGQPERDYGRTRVNLPRTLAELFGFIPVLFPLVYDFQGQVIGRVARVGRNRGPEIMLGFFGGASG